MNPINTKLTSQSAGRWSSIWQNYSAGAFPAAIWAQSTCNFGPFWPPYWDCWWLAVAENRQSPPVRPSSPHWTATVTVWRKSPWVQWPLRSQEYPAFRCPHRLLLNMEGELEKINLNWLKFIYLHQTSDTANRHVPYCPALGKCPPNPALPAR